MTIRTSALISIEGALIISAVALSAYFRLGHAGWDTFFYGGGLAKALLITGVCQMCLYYCDLYDLRPCGDRRDVLRPALPGALVRRRSSWRPSISGSRRLIIGRGVFLGAAAIRHGAHRWVASPCFDWVSSHAAPRERLLIVGTGTAAVGLARELFERRRELAVEIVGFVDPDPQQVGAPVINPGVIGTVEDIPSIVRARSVDRVVVSLADARGKLPIDKLLEMKLDRGIMFDHLASVYEQYTGKIADRESSPELADFLRGVPQDAAAQGCQTAHRHHGRNHRLDGHGASDARCGCPGEVDFARTGPVPPAASRTVRQAVHDSEVPLDAR